MYGKEFCKVYNEFGWNYFPEAFGQQLLKWLRVNKIEVHSALDLGCGTGILCDILHRAGIETLGTDLSENMIRTAKENFPDLCFKTENMVSFTPDREFDLVTCTGDALNHLECLSDIGSLFKNVYASLRCEGYFIFDILSGREIGDGTPIDLDYDEHTSAQFRIVRGEGNTIRLCVTVSVDSHERFEEVVTETLYPADMIRTMLSDAGFINITYSDQLLPDTEGHGTSWYFIAQKPNTV